MKNQRDIWYLLLIQLSVSVFMALIVWVVYDTTASQSILLGGLVCVVPNAYFARLLFRYKGARAAKQIVNSFYKAEALKLLLTIGLFVLVFKLVSIKPWLFFVGFIAAQMMFWFVPLMSNIKQK